MKSSLRARVAALSAAGSFALLGWGLSVPAAGAAPIPAAPAAAPVSTSVGDVTLTVDPASGIDPVAGKIEVQGSGFPTGAEAIVLAICPTNSAAPDDLTSCMGGPVPDANPSPAWAWITADGADSPKGGGVTAKLNPQGSFTVTLSVSDDTLDCSTTPCSVYSLAVGADEDDRSAELALALAFSPVTSTQPTTTTSTTTSSTEPTTTTEPTDTTTTETTESSSQPPRTVEPVSIRSSTILPGEAQQVVFGGFSPGETCTVTLYSREQPLPDVIADQDGIVVIDFTMPELDAGTHTVVAVGLTSGTTGIAQFMVQALPPSPSPTPTPTTSAGPTSSAAPTTSSAVASPTPTTSASPSETSIAPPVAGEETTASGRPWWPWLVVGLIVLLAAGIGGVAWYRRRNRLAAENEERERLLAESAAAEQARAEILPPPPPPGADAPTEVIPAPPGYVADEYGLLSGREDPHNPPLLSGRDQPWTDLPTTAIPPAQVPPAPPTEAIGSPAAGPTEMIGGPTAGPTEMIGEVAPAAEPPAEAPDADGPATPPRRPMRRHRYVEEDDPDA